VSGPGPSRRSDVAAISGLLAAATGGGALVAWISVIVTRLATPADGRAFTLLETTRGSPLARGVKVLAAVGPPLAVLFVIGLVLTLAARRRWRVAAVIVVGYPLAALADHVAKAIAVRPRPPSMLIAAAGYSFPSAEAALSIGLVPIALAIAGLVGRRTGIAVIGVALLLIPAIGALMIAVRVHYLTDVIAGWGLGTVVFALTAAGALAIESRRPGGSA
jgi:membrane-associated phospholipid phosphatase